MFVEGDKKGTVAVGRNRSSDGGEWERESDDVHEREMLAATAAAVNDTPVIGGEWWLWSSFSFKKKIYCNLLD